MAASNYPLHFLLLPSYLVDGILSQKSVTMRNTVVSALLAFLASCSKPLQSIRSGIFETSKEKLDHKQNDSIILWRENYGRYTIWKKTALDYHDPKKTDTSFVHYSKGYQKPKTASILEDSTHKRLRYNPRTRVLRADNKSYRRIGG